MAETLTDTGLSASSGGNTLEQADREQIVPFGRRSGPLRVAVQTLLKSKMVSERETGVNAWGWSIKGTPQPRGKSSCTPTSSANQIIHKT
jgi:hypothetical protein